MEKILLSNFRNKLIRAAEQRNDIPEEICDFAKHLAKRAPRTVCPEQVEGLLIVGLEDLKDGKYGSSSAQRSHILINYKWFLILIEDIGNKTFSKEFRECFKIFCQEPI